MTQKLLACAAFGVLGLGIAQADDFTFTFTDGSYSANGYLTATNNGGGNYTVTSGYCNPSYNKAQAVWDVTAGSGPGYDNKLYIQNNTGYLDGLGLFFQTPGPLGTSISIWDSPQGNSNPPAAGMTYSYNDTNEPSMGDDMGNFVLNAVPEPAPLVAAFGAVLLVRRRKLRPQLKRDSTKSRDQGNLVIRSLRYRRGLLRVRRLFYFE